MFYKKKNNLIKNNNDIYYKSMNKHNKDPYIKHIKQIIFDKYCRESDPCGHSYTLVLNDDTFFTGGGKLLINIGIYYRKKINIIFKNIKII
jgi:hypothetical protein